jgi:hypothetical protein
MSNSIKKVPYESDSWYEMSHMNFSEILQYIGMYNSWKNWDEVLKNKKYKKSILKPINMYVGNFSSKPELIKKSKNEITLKYYTHADILFLIPDPSLGYLGIFKSKPIYAIFYATDKLWLRQFYPSNNTYKIQDDFKISDRVFKFYIPWILDIDIEYTIKNIEENPSFGILEKNGVFTKTDKDVIIKEANFVDFYFTKSKNHMVDDLVGIVKKGTYMFELDIKADKSTIKKIINHYEKI